MEGEKNLISLLSPKRPYIYFLVIYGVGAAGHLIPATRPLMILFTPFVLAGSTAAVLLFSVKEDGPRTWTWLGAAGAVTFVLEVVGVRTGLIFGHYRYGDVLGVKAMDVPLVIALNWSVILFGANILAGIISSNAAIRFAIAVVTVVGIDILIEPVAMKLGYWAWSGGTVPIRNYLAWFIISAFLSGAWVYTGVESRNRAAPFFLVLLAVYFGFLNLV